MPTPNSSRPLHLPFADPLTLVLDATRLQFMMPSAHEMTAPWGIDFMVLSPAVMRDHLAAVGLEPPSHTPPPMRGSIIAVVLGQCCVEVPEQEVRLVLSAGDVVILTREMAFTVRDDWRSPVKSMTHFLRREHLERFSGIRAGGGGAATTFFTGKVIAEDDQDSPLLSFLPPVVCVRGSEAAKAPWMDHTVKFLSSELAARTPGSQSVANHLAHVLFVQAVRAHAATMPEDTATNWFQALFDPDLSAVLGLMYSRLDEQWTVATLAEAAYVSRSSFAERFTAAVGRPPLQFLTECRMRKARDLLRRTQLGIKAIAARVGYSNESAFSNAFKRTVGVSPGAYRDERSTPDPHQK